MWNNQGGGFGGEQSYGDQGGGYLNSPGFGSPAQSQGEKRTRQRAENIIPCTVAQILSATQGEDNFVIDNIKLYQVTMVGIIRSVHETATRIDYQVDDGTAKPIDVKQYVDNEDNTPDSERTIAYRENNYVRLYGHVRHFGDKRTIAAFKIRPITDPNEITTHVLECLHSHMALTKAQNEQPATNMQTNTVGGGQQSFGGGESYSGAQNDGLSNIQRQVHMVIRSCRDDVGYSVGFICDKLKGMAPNQIRDAIEFLSSEGHIYSTIDDEHYRSTDAME